MSSSPSSRACWLQHLEALARPVLTALAAGRLRATMPVETGPEPYGHLRDCAHLEAVARLLCGIAPWFEIEPAELRAGERALQAEFRELAVRGLVNALDPASPDHLNWTQHHQAIVDTAFLSQALLRAPRSLDAALPAEARGRFASHLRALRAKRPAFNNWLLFAATSEMYLLHATGDFDPMRVDYALRQHEQWYAGDGAYSDGPAYHHDYYNSFVIHPMLVDVARRLPDAGERERLLARLLPRAARQAAVLERMIAPDGSFPAVGRSIVYRCGAFHLLAQAALEGFLPAELPPAQARCALAAVIARTLDAPGTYDASGWLRIGLSGHQPRLAESYINTGSLYLAACVFLPLGLSPSHSFWSEPDRPWTNLEAWSGVDCSRDSALRE